MKFSGALLPPRAEPLLVARDHGNTRLQGSEVSTLELGSLNAYRVMKALTEDRPTISIANIRLFQRISHRISIYPEAFQACRAEGVRSRPKPPVLVPDLR